MLASPLQRYLAPSPFWLYLSAAWPTAVPSRFCLYWRWAACTQRLCRATFSLRWWDVGRSRAFGAWRKRFRIRRTTRYWNRGYIAGRPHLRSFSIRLYCACRRWRLSIFYSLLCLWVETLWTFTSVYLFAIFTACCRLLAVAFLPIKISALSAYATTTCLFVWPSAACTLSHCPFLFLDAAFVLLSARCCCSLSLCGGMGELFLLPLLLPLPKFLSSGFPVTPALLLGMRAVGGCWNYGACGTAGVSTPFFTTLNMTSRLVPTSSSSGAAAPPAPVYARSAYMRLAEHLCASAHLSPLAYHAAPLLRKDFWLLNAARGGNHVAADDYSWACSSRILFAGLSSADKLISAATKSTVFHLLLL